MKKSISVLCIMSLLFVLCGCETNSGSAEASWLPIDKNYLQMPTALWDALVAEGKVVKSEIVFPVGGGFFKKAIYTSESGKITYSDHEFVYYGRLLNCQLPILLSGVSSWLGNEKEYLLSYSDLNQTEQAAFDYSLPTALYNLQTQRIEQLSETYAGEWDYGVLYVLSSDGNTILWQLILTV